MIYISPGFFKNRRAFTGLVLLVFTVVLSSCVCPEVIESTKLPSQQDHHLAEQNRQLGKEVERLELELAGKQRKIKELVLSKQNSTREVVRTKAKLRSHSSKAGTVANIAEVKSVLKAAAETQMTDQQKQIVLETEQVIVMSVEALKQDNVEKAFDLSSTAQQLIQPIRALQVKNFLSNGSDIVFLTPMPMQVLKVCNVRLGPGMTSGVLFTLKSGSQVQALSYVKNWVQIESEQRGKGWVHSRLLEIVP